MAEEFADKTVVQPAVKPGNWFDRLEQRIHSVSTIGAYVSGIILIAMALVVVIDVIGRKIGMPLKGNLDIGEIMMIGTAFFAMAFTQHKKGFVRVDLLTSRLPKRVQAGIDVFVWTISFGIYALITYAVTARVLDILTSSNPPPVSLLLEIPLVFLFIVLIIGCVWLCLEFLIDIIRSVQKAAGK